MCKQLKEKLLQTLMDNMGSVIDTLDEHSKSINELEQRIKQLSEKDGATEGNKNIEFTVESATLENRDRYDVANGEYCKFIDTEHPEAYVIAILKSPYEKGKVVMCHALLVHEQNGVETLYVSDETLSAPYSNYSRGFCNLIGKYASFCLRETYKRVDLTKEDVKQINDYIKRVGYTVDFKGVVVVSSSGSFVCAKITRPLFKTPKRRHVKHKNE